MEQLRAQARLEFLHLATDRGLGKAQRTRRAHETAVLDHLDENQGVVEIVRHRRLLRVIADWPACWTIIPSTGD